MKNHKSSKDKPAKVGNQRNPFPAAFFASPCTPKLFAIYLDLSRATQYLFILVSVFSELFRH